MLRLVPFNMSWVTNDRIDVHAIYQRPRYKQDEYGDWHREYDANGMPTWDLTSPLPVKSHNKWVQKGFRYVTLANRDSLVRAAETGTLQGGSFRDYDQSQAGGPWNYRKFKESQQDTDSAELEKLRVEVAKYGAEAVESIRQSTDPEFRLPDSLKGEPKKGKAEKVSA
jgi:hypothetical protein